MGAIYAPDRRSGQAAARLLRNALSKQVDTIAIANWRTIAIARRLHGKFGLDFSNLIAEHDPERSRWLGAPTAHGENAYWRMRERPAPPLDLDKDGVGAIWHPPVILFHGDAVAQAVDITYEVMLAHGFEPGIAFHCLRPRIITKGYCGAPHVRDCSRLSVTTNDGADWTSAGMTIDWSSACMLLGQAKKIIYRRSYTKFSSFFV